MVLMNPMQVASQISKCMCCSQPEFKSSGKHRRATPYEKVMIDYEWLEVVGYFL
jgi:hypothetical protein